MRSELESKLNDWAFTTKELIDDLRNDPAPDAVFVVRALSKTMGLMDMELSNQWGKKLVPRKAEAAVEEDPIEEKPKPKAKKSG